jgi:sRNA-binding protein
MLESEAGRSVLANTSYTLLLRQRPAVIDDIQKTFHLSNTEKVNLLTANVGEGLLLMEDEHSEIKIVASELEHKQITTNADEILANNNKQANEKQEQTKPIQPTAETASQKPAVRVVISVDTDKRFYRHRDLKLDDIKYLLAEGYKEYEFKGILGNKKELYLMKPNYNESPQHFFLVNDIAEYIKKFPCKVETFNTAKPDIVFEINKKKYAIEIETGKVIKDKKKFGEKVKSLKKNYGKKWFFVVTDWNLQKKYSKFGETYTKLTLLNKLLGLLKNV